MFPIYLGWVAMQVFVPLLTREKYAEAVGLSAEVVRGQIARGYLPTVRIGRHRMVNLEALRQRAAEQGTEFTLKAA
jgi:hypothetical protein